MNEKKTQQHPDVIWQNNLDPGSLDETSGLQNQILVLLDPLSLPLYVQSLLIILKQLLCSLLPRLQVRPLPPVWQYQN